MIQESIRLSPGTRALMGKTVPKGGDVINGLHIPAGTTVHHNMGSLLRSRALFGPDADIFRPERFLDCDEDRRWTMARDVELQFGSGRWTCVGRNIAMMVINKTAVEVRRSKPTVNLLHAPVGTVNAGLCKVAAVFRLPEHQPRETVEVPRLRRRSRHPRLLAPGHGRRFGVKLKQHVPCQKIELRKGG